MAALAAMVAGETASVEAAMAVARTAAVVPARAGQWVEAEAARGAAAVPPLREATGAAEGQAVAERAVGRPVAMEVVRAVAAARWEAGGARAALRGA